ncbi:MAG: glycosyltransferase family 2 protein [Desulfobulbaceae bacterium]|nr:glycosyltransferase family 2 protein [Desulfobulbaceae bacterium]
MKVAGGKVVAVVATYEPDTELLTHLLERLASQVTHVIVVDNGSAMDVAKWLAARNDPRLHCLPLGNNLGVATAQNSGIGWARQHGADFVVLFDQDSEPAPDMIEKLLAAAAAMTAKGYAVAAVGPRYLDVRHNNPPPFVRARGLQLEYCDCGETDAVIPVDYLISSGCLMPMATLATVGDMTDALFIDYVDIEWGLRAKHLGYQSFGVCNAAMRHNLGDQPIVFLGRLIPQHNPLRHYYQFRNAVWLYRQSWPPLNWKLIDVRSLLLKYCFYALFVKPRWKHFKMMTLGLWHALRGKGGRFEEL